MNKNILMVLAVIVALLAGWLVLSIAFDSAPGENEEVPVSTAPEQVHAPAVPVPSSTDITVTVVETMDPNAQITAEVVR